jgi:cytochrome c556
LELSKRLCMKKKMLPFLFLTGAATASLAGPVEDQIRFRQSAYSFAAWNLGKIKSQLQHPDSFDRELVVGAADAIAAIADSGLASLYGKETAQGTGWEKTRVKPDYFEKPEEAREASDAFIQASRELAKVARTGDIAEIKTQFGKTSATCKSCHDAFRYRDAPD